jgi:hypothetical protein
MTRKLNILTHKQELQALCAMYEEEITLPAATRQRIGLFEQNRPQPTQPQPLSFALALANGRTLHATLPAAYPHTAPTLNVACATKDRKASKTATTRVREFARRRAGEAGGEGLLFEVAQFARQDTSRTAPEGAEEAAERKREGGLQRASRAAKTGAQEGSKRRSVGEEEVGWVRLLYIDHMNHRKGYQVVKFAICTTSILPQPDSQKNT